MPVGRGRGVGGVVLASGIGTGVEGRKVGVVEYE